MYIYLKTEQKRKKLQRKKEDGLGVRVCMQAWVDASVCVAAAYGACHHKWLPPVVRVN